LKLIAKNVALPCDKTASINYNLYMVRPIESKCCAHDFSTVEFNLYHLWLDWFFLRKLQKSKGVVRKEYQKFVL